MIRGFYRAPPQVEAEGVQLEEEEVEELPEGNQKETLLTRRRPGTAATGPGAGTGTRGGRPRVGGSAGPAPAGR